MNTFFLSYLSLFRFLSSASSHRRTTFGLLLPCFEGRREGFGVELNEGSLDEEVREEFVYCVLVLFSTWNSKHLSSLLLLLLILFARVSSKTQSKPFRFIPDGNTKRRRKSERGQARDKRTGRI